MRKLKAPEKKHLTLKDHLEQYDGASLKAMLQELQNSHSWEVFAAFLSIRQREFEIAALDLACKHNMQPEAAKASGYAQGLEDVVNVLIPELKNLVIGYTGVVENPRPVEDVVG